jgi:hypothetical protein
VKDWRNRQDEGANRRGSQRQHAARLASTFRKMRTESSRPLQHGKAPSSPRLSTSCEAVSRSGRRPLSSNAGRRL